MGVRRTYHQSGSLVNGENFFSLISQSNKKILIERIYLEIDTSSNTGNRAIIIGIQSQIYTNIYFHIINYTYSTTSSQFLYYLGNFPSSFPTINSQLSFPLILTSNDQFFIQINDATTGDSYIFLIEYLEMDLDEEIWQ